MTLALLWQSGLACAALLSAAWGAPARAEYPEKPITIIVPSSAGGPADVSSRLISEKMAQVLGQQLVIETVPGAGGTIGMGRVARAQPDGYTLLVHQTGFAITPHIYAKLNFDTAKDFATVGLLNNSASLLVSRGSLDVKTYTELEAWAKGAGKPAKYAHPGPGTYGHLFTVMHSRAAGMDASLVSYRGIAPAVNDLLGDHIDIAMVGAAVATPLIKEGKIKLFATTAAKRSAAFPDAPTFGEVGHKELQRPFWHAMFAPAATPKPVIDRLNAAIKETMKDPKVLKLYGEAGLEAYSEEMLSPAASHAFVQEEIELWGKVVRDNNVKVD